MLPTLSSCGAITTRHLAPGAASLAATTLRRTAVSSSSRHASASTSRFAPTLVSLTRKQGYVTTTNPNSPLGKSNATNTSPSSIALIGARGYTGTQLVELLNNHPHMDLAYVSSRELMGTKVEGYTKKDVIYVNLSPEELAEKADEIDCIVLALPNGVCKPFVDALDKAQEGKAKKTIVVDLSADHRFDDKWTYGLPELTRRADIAQAKRISNPGCYATAAQLSLAPILDKIASPPVLFGVSGYSGAGRKASSRNNVDHLTGGVLPYSLTGHMHEKECSYQLSKDSNFKPQRINFIPHVSSWFRGIHETINIQLNTPTTSRDIRNIFQERYAGEKLVKVVGEAPYVKEIQNKHGVEIGGFSVDDTGKRVVICSTIDNLNKGASTQCLQNMNLALGYDEYEGIPLD